MEDPYLRSADEILPVARRIRARVRDRLGPLLPPFDLVLTGGSSVPGALTKGDVDLHLRVAPEDFDTTVAVLRGLYPVVHPEIWQGSLATFDVEAEVPAGLAVTPTGSEHDHRFRRGWEVLAADPRRVAAYNVMKLSGRGDYESRKSAFFDHLLAGDVLVIGAGVSGLTTAVCLAEAGFKVRIWSSGTGGATTSFAAGATWSPYLVEASPRVAAWSFETLEMMRALSADPATGITLMPGVEASRVPVEPPPWRDRLAEFRMCGPGDLPAGFAAGWRYVAPVVSMPTYLGYLRGRAECLGVDLEIREADRLDLGGVVIDCAGIGARTLVPDPALTPVRGQIVVVENPGVTEWFVEEGEPPVYFFPHGDTVVLGGTAQAGDADTTPDPAVAAAILERCAAVEPRFAGVRVLGHRVGLRPVRDHVRLEGQQVGDTRVIHNYGHGGAGVTLSWGCAREVVRLLSRFDGDR
jgi:D-amino-acid oxidase